MIATEKSRAYNLGFSLGSDIFFSLLITRADLSRLGRNYIEVGRLTEEFFPNHDIRLVAVSDNIDTDEGENELAPIRNLFKNISHSGKVIGDFSLFRRF